MFGCEQKASLGMCWRSNKNGSRQRPGVKRGGGLQIDRDQDAVVVKK